VQISLDKPPSSSLAFMSGKSKQEEVVELCKERNGDTETTNLRRTNGTKKYMKFGDRLNKFKIQIIIG
jgi:hypothetical protein